MQTTFHYDYGSYKYAFKQAKRMRGDSPYIWIVQSPKDGRYKVLEGETIEDRPTRVQILWEHREPPPRQPNQREMDRDNLVWLANQALQNEENSELAQAIIDYLENHNA
jgi:hypothetical protein